jgi:lipoprotein NlpI/transglutaminase-like putative cysteine protease
VGAVISHHLAAAPARLSAARRFASAVRSFVRIAFLLPALAYAQAAPTTTPAEPAPLREVQVAAGAFSLGDAPPAWVEPIAIPPTTDTRSVVMRLADTQFHVASTISVYVRRAILVNDASALSEAGQIPISFVPEYQKLRLHAVRILRGEEVLDRTRSSNVRFLQRETGLERGIYSGHVTASVLVNDLRVGDTLEYVYSTEGENPVFGGRFSDMSSWDQPNPVDLRRVIVSHPAERSIAWKMLGPAQDRKVTSTESTANGRRTLRFEERSMPAVRGERFVPYGHVQYRTLQFSEYPRWRDVVDWAQPLFKPEGALNDELKQLVEKLRQLPTPEERVIAALDFVQSEIRYFSVSLGESSHRPTHPNVTLARRYGDCKDKSLLLITLLEAVGVEARPVLLSVGTRKGLEQTLPGPQLFDHVIVQARVGDAVHYLDATRLGQRSRLARMGQLHEGAQVLVVGRDTDALSTIANPDRYALVRGEVTETAVVDKLGENAQLESRQLWNGVAAETMRTILARLPRTEVARFLTAAMERRYAGAKIVGEPQIEDNVAENTLVLRARYSVPKLVDTRGGDWFARVSAINFADTFALPSFSDRRSPVVIPGYPSEARYTLEVQFPEEVRAMRDPYNQTIRSKTFAYTIASSFRGRTARTTIDLKTFADRVEVEDLRRFREDLEKVDKLAPHRVIVVLKNDIKGGTVLGLIRKDFKQVVQDRLRDVVEKTSATIQSAKLTGDDLANAYCERANAHSDLGEYEAALRDANAALKIAPNSTRSLTCRAETYFSSGDFQKSAADYSRALSLGEATVNTYYRRGVARYYAGELDAAQEDLRKASELATTEPDLYVDLWLTWISKRLGKAVPEAASQRALAEPRGEWPRPALAMLHDKLQPDDMLRLLERKTGDDLQMARAEGYFYLAQYHLIHGDKPKAREYFEKTRDLGVLMYTEHVAARFELERLKRGD